MTPEIIELDKRVIIVEARQEDNIKRLDRVEIQIELLEKNLQASINDIKIIIASAKGSALAIMFIAPFIFAGLSFMSQMIINKMFN